MKLIFADTSFYVALLNKTDVHQGQAVQFLRAPAGKILTTDYVLLEVGNFMCRPADRPYFLAMVDGLINEENVEIVEASRERQTQGLELYRRRPDKSWSLTDCISFVVMEERGVTEALTADRHFEQAGFKALLM